MGWDRNSSVKCAWRGVGMRITWRGGEGWGLDWLYVVAIRMTFVIVQVSDDFFSALVWLLGFWYEKHLLQLSEATDPKWNNSVKVLKDLRITNGWHQLGKIIHWMSVLIDRPTDTWVAGCQLSDNSTQETEAESSSGSGTEARRLGLGLETWAQRFLSWCRDLKKGLDNNTG